LREGKRIVMRNRQTVRSGKKTANLGRRARKKAGALLRRKTEFQKGGIRRMHSTRVEMRGSRKGKKGPKRVLKERTPDWVVQGELVGGRSARNK